VAIGKGQGTVLLLFGKFGFGKFEFVWDFGFGIYGRPAERIIIACRSSEERPTELAVSSYFRFALNSLNFYS
jgi:hypothetical protein